MWGCGCASRGEEGPVGWSLEALMVEGGEVAVEVATKEQGGVVLQGEERVDSS